MAFVPKEDKAMLHIAVYHSFTEALNQQSNHQLIMTRGNGLFASCAALTIFCPLFVSTYVYSFVLVHHIFRLPDFSVGYQIPNYGNKLAYQPKFLISFTARTRP
jgi:hypothetical protein